MADSTSDDQIEIIRAFAQESCGLIDQLEPYINELGKNKGLQAINYIYGFFHSIKGGASFMGLSNIAHVTNAVENLLDQLRSGKIPLQTPEHVNLLNHACDFLKEALDHLGSHPNDNDLGNQAESVVSEFKNAVSEPLKLFKLSRILRADQNVRKTLIVGGGRGCSTIIPLLSNEKNIHILGICDINETAPGVLLAKKFGIPITKDFKDFLQKNEVDFIIDVTGNPEVNLTLNSMKKSGVEILGGLSAKLILELVLEKENRKEEIEENLAEQEALNRIGLLLFSAKNIDVVFQRIVQCAVKLSKNKAGSLALYDEKTNEFKTEVAIGFSETFLKTQRWKLRKNGLTDYILSNKQPTIIPDITKNVHFNNSVVLQEGIKSLIAVPLILAGKAIGILYVNDYKPKKITPRLTSLMVSLATQATFAIEKNKLLQKAEQLAIIDALTQLYNHRYFVTALEKEVIRSKRFQHPICFLMMDIDFFKHYNDTQGHETANIVLRTLAKLMGENTREIDTLARYGGEEFCLILPGVDVEGGKNTAERIREAIENHPFPHEDEQPGGKLTISIGLASYPKDADTGTDLVKKADSALYKAKKAGKNRVVVFE
ncbi:MAG: diguanylate cyclase [Nitrospinota bacterium]